MRSAILLVMLGLVCLTALQIVAADADFMEPGPRILAYGVVGGAFAYGILRAILYRKTRKIRARR